MPGCSGAVRRAFPLLLACTAVIPAAAQDQAPPGPDAQRGVPGSADPTATHQGTATVAAVAAPARTVDLSLLYTAELWGNLSGGRRRGARYLDNLDLRITVDAERLVGWQGATLFVYGLYNNGRAFSGDLVGDAQTVSNIETGVRAARLYQAWVEQRFAGGRASLKAGLYDLNSEFDTTNVGSVSILSSHGIGPEFGQSGRNGPSIFPATSLALRADYRFGDALTLRAAVLDGVPGDPRHPGRTAVRLGHGEGALLVAEADWNGALAAVTAGVWTYSARLPRLSGGRGRGDAGAYLVVERRLFGTGSPGADDARGLAAFFQAGHAAPGFNRISRYVGGGLVLTGVIGSTADRLGLTFAHAAFGRPFRRAQAAAGVAIGPAEDVVELTYRRPVSRLLTLQPDLQWIRRPGGGVGARDALAIGLRVQVGR